MKRPKPISLQPFARAACMLTMSCSIALAQDANNREPDPRFKADILVVVAHPDDETMVTAYLAREIHDHHRSVAVVVATRGDGGNNAVGPEQAAAMGDIREMEGRRALASLGISNVWFLGGPDTPSQNVLQSLESWDHGRCLGRLVRIVRLTRPSVILSFVPAFLSGENHGDHQAAGVLATEAFDLAGDPIAFPEQVSPARDPNATGNLTEALHTWQPQKIYYFANPYENVFTSKGPEYSSTEMSASQHTTYAELAAQAFTFHMTQGGGNVQRSIGNKRLDALQEPVPFADPVRLLFGKSLVPSGVTDDVFAGIKPDGIPFRRPPGFTESASSEPSLQIGDPWNFYDRFWQAHGLASITDLAPSEVSIMPNSKLYVPMIIDNPTSQAIHAVVSINTPSDWQTKPLGPVTVPPRTRYYLKAEAQAHGAGSSEWQEVVISAKDGSKSIGSVSIRVNFAHWAAPQ